MICLLERGGGCPNCGGFVLNAIRTPHGNFCAEECAADYAERAESARRDRETEWCAECGYDRHEHGVGCPRAEVTV